MSVRSSTSVSLAGWILTAVLLCFAKSGNAAEKSDRYDAFMASMSAEHNFNGSVLVSKGGRTLISAGYGVANAEWNAPNSATTRFRIGSVSKQFTAVGILILVERGELKLDDFLSAILPNTPANWAEIRVRHLLNHTSGIPHSWKLTAFTETIAHTQMLDDVIDQSKGEPLLFEPGSAFSYSGYGYFILARIIETVSGQSLDEFFSENVYEPFGMHSTGIDSYESIIPERASGYVRIDDELKHSPLVYMPNLNGGGSLYSTVGDLAKWHAGLAKKMLISEALYEQMYTPVLKNYGFGWRIVERNGYTVYEHTGGVYGFHAFIKRIPDIDAVVVVLTNIANEPSWKKVAEGLEAIVTER
ncbi:MAG: serine hydrolase domain-containing protein [Woeseia sp.]